MSRETACVFEVESVCAMVLCVCVCVRVEREGYRVKELERIGVLKNRLRFVCSSFSMLLPHTHKE